MMKSQMPERLERTSRLLEEGIEQGLQFGAQLHVSLGNGNGERERIDGVIGERAEGLPMTPDTLMLWLSSTKPVSAVAWARLWEQGKVDLDDPVALHVPEFAAKGKDRITLRHVLTHTSGFRLLNLGWPEASWEEIITTLCNARPEPRWTPGQKAGYHMASSWFMLGEVVRRVDGRPFSEYVREEVFEPLGMNDSWIGMPETRYRSYGDRLGKMYLTEKGKRMPRGWDRPPHVLGCSPGGNGYGPVRELARFYEMLLNGGATSDGIRILSPQTVEALTTPHRVGMMDLTFKQKLDWGLGFITNSSHYGEELVAYGYGKHASRRTFGHSGFQSSTAFADPVADLVVALVVNGNPGEPRHTQRFRDLTEAIYEDLELASPS